MSRVKTFDATGIAPGGRLFAADLNAIQDQYADMVNYSQNHGVNTLAVGDSALQILKFAAGEMRMTGRVRTDGILRGLGGLFAGQFTTAQRDAIPIGTGDQPRGLIIYNTTLQRLEVNIGTDTTPNWVSVGPDPFWVGMMLPFAGEVAALTGIVEPKPGWWLCNGATFNDSSRPELATFLGGAYGIPGSGQTSLPNIRGKVVVGRSTDAEFDTRGESGGAKTHVLATGEMPVHAHIQNSHNHTQNSHNHTQNAHGHASTPHSHEIQVDGTGSLLRLWNTAQGGGGQQAAQVGGSNSRMLADSRDANVQANTAVNQAATAVNQAATPTEQNEGGGAAHNNLQPYVVIGGYIIKHQMLAAA